MNKAEIQSEHAESPKSEVIRKFITRCPFEHKDLACVLLSGSQNNRSSGPQSDIDIITIMHSGTPDRLSVEPILTLGQQLQEACTGLRENTPITPVVISTIRLEEAQIQIAQLVNPNRIILPVHWLHYPSVEFLVTNEPPELARGLLRGNVIKGATPISPTGSFPEPIRLIAGLDWLTDSLRVLIANNSACFPIDFLKKHASHNLHYFWKWKIIAGQIQQTTGLSSGDWAPIETQARKQLPQLMATFDQVHRLRHQSESASIQNIIELHNQTFSIWHQLA